MRSETFDEVIRGFYRAGVGRESWGAAMARLAHGMDMWGAQLIGVDRTDGTLLFAHDGGVAPPAAALDYVRTYHRVNPRMGPTLELAPGQWFHDHERFDEAFVASHPFYRDFLIPYGGRYASAAKVVEDDRRLVLFAAMRGKGSRPFDDDERGLLERMRLHLQEALAMGETARDAPPAPMVGAALLNEFDRPMLLIDAERRIRFRNDAAAALLADGDYVQESGGMLRCLHAAGDAALSAALHELRLAPSGLAFTTPRPERRFVRTLTVPGRQPVGVYLVALRPESSMAAFGGEAVALVFFHDPRITQDVDPLIAAETFGLTPAEARVAVALAAGLTVNEIAARDGLSVSTVRTHIRSIFSKTDTDRQADLVRLLTAMPPM